MYIDSYQYQIIAVKAVPLQENRQITLHKHLQTVIDIDIFYWWIEEIIAPGFKTKQMLK